MPFKSRLPDIDLPQNVTIWNWLFDSQNCPISQFSKHNIAGYQNYHTKERADYHEVKKYTTWISTALVKKYGMKQGDTVALFSPNNIWYPITMLAVVRIGGVFSGASPAYNVEEMTYALKTSGARFLFTVPGSMKVALDSARNAGIPKENIFLLEGVAQGHTTVKQLLEIGKSLGEDGQVKSFELPPGQKNSQLCAFLTFSSGTTGLPKAVMISHGNLIAQCLQIRNITPPTHTKVVAVLPAYHITGLVHIMHLPILINAEVYMIPSFSMKTMLDAATEHKIEEILLVPPILIRLVRDPIVDKYDLRCVKRFSTGAAPVSEEILHLLEKKFPWTGFKQGYGMTESCSAVCSHPPSKYSYKYAHTVGMIVSSTEVKIVDEHGNELGIDEPGELLARGPQVTMGYLNAPKATSETFMSDGYLRTGDQAVIDSEGVVTITDRIKEMIKVKGIGVAPAELEDLLLGHPHVEDCAVLAIKDDYSGERPKAYVVARKGAPEDEKLGKLLLQYVKDKKTRHKWIKEIEFIDAIPKSPSGKILRRILRNMSKTTPKGNVVKDAVSEKARL